jgi:hypothetical protein
MPVPDDVASLAFSVAASGGSGAHQNLYLRLSTLICWDAAMWCASRKGGIVLPDPDSYYQGLADFMLIRTAGFDSLFPTNQCVHVPTPNDVYNIPKGAFVGFFRVHPGTPPRPKELRHVMIYCLAGQVAGSRNATIFPTSQGNWETVHLADFFKTPAHTITENQTHIFYSPVSGRTVRKP